MTTERDTGGPAFPVIGAPGAPEDYPGATLRDYFAAKALQGLLPASETYSRELARLKSETPLEKFMAALAYCYADAMLKERTK
jgi:hypothetical protein